jgi:hypothetical protein
MVRCATLFCVFALDDNVDIVEPLASQVYAAVTFTTNMV